MPRATARQLWALNGKGRIRLLPEQDKPVKPVSQTQADEAIKASLAQASLEGRAV